MQFEGKKILKYNIDNVWLYLNDPYIIKVCIDGCKTFMRVEDNKYEAVVNVKLGPVNATFKGNILINNIIKPTSYTIEANGNAGQLGFARSNVKVNLEEHNLHTVLSYKADVNISGRIAQIGSRLIEGSVKKNTERFFQNLEVILGEDKISKNDAQTKNKVSKKTSVLKESKVFLIFLFMILMLVFLSLAYN